MPTHTPPADPDRDAIDFDNAAPPPNSVWGDTVYEQAWSELIKAGGIPPASRKPLETTVPEKKTNYPKVSEDDTNDAGWEDEEEDGEGGYDREKQTPLYANSVLDTKEGDTGKSGRKKEDTDFYTIYDITVTYDKVYSRTAFATTNPASPTALVYTGQPQLFKKVAWSIAREGRPPKLPRFAPLPGENIELTRRTITPMELDTVNGSTATYKISGVYEYIVMNPRHMSRFIEFPVAPHIAVGNPLTDTLLDLKHDVFAPDVDLISTFYNAKSAVKPKAKNLTNQPRTDGGG